MTDFDNNENLSSSVYAGMRIQLNPAPLPKRFMAYAIDMGVVVAVLHLVFFVAIIFFGVSFLTLHRSDAAKAILGIFALIVLLGILCLIDIYFIYWERNRGATPGKKLFGLRVVSLEGGAISLGKRCLGNSCATLM